MSSIMPFPRAVSDPAADLDGGFLSFVLSATEPELHAFHLPGEDAQERAARRAAAADILDDLAAEYTAGRALPAPDEEPGRWAA